MMAAGGRSRSTLSVPGSPRLTATLYESGEVARELVAQIGVVVDDRQGVLGSARHSDLPRGRGLV